MLHDRTVAQHVEHGIIDTIRPGTHRRQQPTPPHISVQGRGINAFSVNTSSSRRWRSSNCSMTAGDSLAVSWSRLSTNSGASSSYTAILVEVDPGLITRMRNMLTSQAIRRSGGEASQRGGIQFGGRRPEREVMTTARLPRG
ncbi:MAG: hypothetical protein ACLSAH_01980 [Bilophila wadsworthia]